MRQKEKKLFTAKPAIIMKSIDNVIREKKRISSFQQAESRDLSTIGRLRGEECYNKEIY